MSVESLVQRKILFTALYIVSRPRFYFCVSLGILFLLLYQSLEKVSAGIQRLPLDSQNNLTPPVLSGSRNPVVEIDLNNVQSLRDPAQNKKRVLILTPLHNAASHIQRYFKLIVALTYPHELIDLGFLVGDTQDESLTLLTAEADQLQRGEHAVRSIQVISRDFGSDIPPERRHDFALQGPRRKLMGRVRNYLLYTTLKPDHDWVFWRDVDVEESPPSILEDFMSHDKDVVVPNIWYHKSSDGVDTDGRFDYNSWQESPDALELAKSLDKDEVIVEGYDIYNTNRQFLALMGSRHGNLSEEIPLDGVGGVSLLVKADVHRSGVNFPCYAFENHAETEGFGKMAKRAGYQVVGLPNYIVWHVNG